MARKVIIVGGVAGGASSAARLRRIDEKVEIILFEKGEYISFANCGLPYYVGEVIKEKEKLVVQTPESMRKRFNIDIRINSEVVKIDRANKKVDVKNIQTGEIYQECYDKLVLSPGADPIRPPLPGIDSSKIFTLRNIPDTYKIKDFVDENKPKSAMVVGAGFIGLEMAENLHEKGINVTIVELGEHVLGPLDYDMAAIVHQHLKSKKIGIFLKDGVKSFQEVDDTIKVELNSGTIIEVDMVLLGIGVRPEKKLAVEAGLEIGTTGAILVDNFMKTSDPDIYAVGDAVEVEDFINKNKVVVPLAGPANKQGRIVANNICGLEEKYTGTQGTSILKVFDTTVALTGNNEKTLKKYGIEYEKIFIHPLSHAGYYPGAVQLSLKLIFDKESGKIFGAQIIGYEGVDKRIDVIATAIRAGMTVFDLQDLELAYAPPYSSAKDPVNMAGYVASNVVKNDMEIFHWHDVENAKNDGLILDVRTKSEYSLGSIEGALNIDVDDLRGNLDKLPKDKMIYIFCQVGLRGYIAYKILKQNGFEKIKNLMGGYKTYNLAIQEQSNKNIFTKEDYIKKANVDISTNCKGECIEQYTLEADACGLQCPGPVMKVYNTIKEMKVGEILKVTATDPAFEIDVRKWCESTGNTLINLVCEKNIIKAFIRKEEKQDVNSLSQLNKNNKTMVIFSSDLDRALAAFVIANGAVAMGREVTMFFTFWGLNILRKDKRVSVKKDIISKMFGIMMPRGLNKLTLSKLNMGGMGAVLIKYLMKKKNIFSMQELIDQAQKSGVKLVACTMSMDLMGIKKEELIENVEFGGVATFLNDAEKSDMNLFI